MKAWTACCSRFGRRKHRAFPWWAISTAGTGGCIRCASASTAACGRFSRPALAKAPITNTRSLAPAGKLQPLKADPMGFGGEMRPSTASVVTKTDSFDWHDEAHMAARQGAGARQGPDEHLRGASRLLAAQRLEQLSFLRRSCQPAHPLCGGYGLHPYRAAAGLRASARRLLGLPAHRPVRAHAALRRSGRLPALRRWRAYGGPWRDPRLGARALSHRRARPRQFRRRRPLRASRSAPRLSPGLEYRHLRFRPARGREFPDRQRALLARPLPHRRPARRCGGLDALSRLFAQGRRVAAERRKAATRTATRCASCSAPTSWSTAPSRAP